VIDPENNISLGSVIRIEDRFTGFPPSGSTLCPRCDYDLSGLPVEYRCPECDFAYDEHSRACQPNRAYRPIIELIAGAYLTTRPANTTDTMTNVAFDVQNAKKEVRNAAFAPPFVLPVLPGSAPVLPVALRVLPFVAFAVHFAVFALPFSARVLHFVAPVLPFAAFAVHFSQVADPSPPLVTLARHMRARWVQKNEDSQLPPVVAEANWPPAQGEVPANHSNLPR